MTISIAVSHDTAIIVERLVPAQDDGMKFTPAHWVTRNSAVIKAGETWSAHIDNDESVRLTPYVAAVGAQDGPAT